MTMAKFDVCRDESSAANETGPLPYTVATFYRFAAIEDCESLRSSLLASCRQHDIRGTILIAREGINATVSGRDEDVRALLAGLRADARFAAMPATEHNARGHVFQRLKIKVKPEIVTIRAPGADPQLRVGHYVKPESWNALIAEPGVAVIDVRNGFEVALGSFAGALDPGTRQFSEFPNFVHRNLDPARTPRIAMFCTGGIRCEKASSLMLAMGFPEVYHLEGGILKYLEVVPREASLWRGACFVFDERGAVS